MEPFLFYLDKKGTGSEIIFLFSIGTGSILCIFGTGSQNRFTNSKRFKKTIIKRGDHDGL
jgi:hypothetical protein